MYSSVTENDQSKKFYESTSLEVPWVSKNQQECVFTEAVFADGKSTVKPLEENMQKIKDRLEELIKAQEDESKNKEKAFDPKLFWKDQVFKDLEDELMKIFGFRNVEIEPFIERYNSKDKTFESKILNCFVFSNDRFPIEGLVTEKGFYDKSKSTNMRVAMTLGLIRSLTAQELLAILLHEFGHAIDPALVDIKYTQVNILSKYLTDRKTDLNSSEKKLINNRKNSVGAMTGAGIGFLMYFMFLLLLFLPGILKSFGDFILRKFQGEEKVMQKKLNKVRDMIKNDKSNFTRQESIEAYADNFARMYGYGHVLMSAIKKISADSDSHMISRYKREYTREKFILNITEMLIKDVHKTDIHRIRNLIKEYKDDIDDPNTPPEVKKQLKDDLTELEKVLDEYLNNFSKFQNRVNRVINEELQKIEVEDKSSDKTEKKVVKEGVEFFDESTKAYEKLMKAKESLNSSERAEVNKLFGHSNKCSFAKDEKGYYCFTHRARSDSYPTIAEIPKKSVEFVRSTS